MNNTTTAFDAYILFSSLRLHFNSQKYDFFKYNGKINASSSFHTRRDRYQYEKLIRHYRNQDIVDFLVANLIENSNVWIGDLMKNLEESQQVYLNWKRKKESRAYCFSEDVSRIAEQESNFDLLFLCNRNEHPKLLDLYNEGTISFETLLGVDLVVDCFVDWDKQLRDDIIWRDIYRLALKYEPFLGHDKKTKEKFKDILKKEFLVV